MMPVSIIVPVLNEQADIEATLTNLRGACGEADELIVVDGGSSDQTCTLAQPLCDKLIGTGKGRARQLNAGAAVAIQPVLWFVHADTTVPVNGSALVCDALAARTEACWGRFNVRFTSPEAAFSVIAFFMNWRSRLTGIATGDQALFVTRAGFDHACGFPDLPLMEDIEFSKSLKKQSAPICLTSTVTTSSRRWEKNGILRTVLLMWKLRLLHFIGVPTERLARLYRS